jgi:hypothetical protein
VVQCCKTFLGGRRVVYVLPKRSQFKSS